MTTLTGDRFHLRLKKSGKRLAQSFYGCPVEIDSDLKSIFFTSSSLKKRKHEKPLGEVLSQQGMRNIRMDGIQKIFQGMTDLLQVNKVSA